MLRFVTEIYDFGMRCMSCPYRLKIDDPVNAVAVHGGGGMSIQEVLGLSNDQFH